MSFTLHRIAACLIALVIGAVALPAVAQDENEGEKSEQKEEKIDPYAELQRANKLA